MAKEASGMPSMILGTRLCEDLGLDPKKVTAVSFSARINELPSVTVEMIADNDDEIAVLRRFRITAAEEETPSPPFAEMAESLEAAHG